MQKCYLTNVDATNLQAEIIYTTAVCVQSVNLNIQLLYDINNIRLIITKPYMANATDSFILLLLQPNSTVSYTIQVINTVGNIVGNASTDSFVVPVKSTIGFPKQSRYICTLVVMHCDDVCYNIGLSNSAVSGITFAVSVPITALVTVIISCLITYYCCV